MFVYVYNTDINFSGIIDGASAFGFASFSSKREQTLIDYIQKALKLP